MGIAADDLAAPSGSSVKFQNVGDGVKGAVVYVGDWRTQKNKFSGADEEVLRIGLDTGDEEVAYVYVRKGDAKAKAIADALREAGLAQLQVGQQLAIRFSEERDTGKPQPFKVFQAKIEPGEKTAAAADDFWS